jgi:hypothetical protein
MALPVFYDYCGEDSDFLLLGSTTVLTVSTAGTFRTPYARQGLAVSQGFGAVPVDYWRRLGDFSLSLFWHSVRVWSTGISGSYNAGGQLVRWLSGTGASVNRVVRLRMRNTGAGNPFGASTFVIEKVTAAGVATQIGSSFNLVNVGSGQSIKLDFRMNYGVSGGLDIYVNANFLVYTVSGVDMTTDGNTTLTGYDLGSHAGGSGSIVWSEFIISDSDTRSMTLQYFAPVANGNTHNYTVAAASNVNENVLNTATLDYSDTVGQIDQYTIAALPAGSWSILSFGVNAYARCGWSGPLKQALGVRSGTTDAWSSDFTLSTVFALTSTRWDADPTTAVAWAALPVNIGLRSAA